MSEFTKTELHKRFSGVFEKWENDKLFAAGRAVEPLFDSPGWKIVSDLLNEYAHQVQRAMVTSESLQLHQFHRYAGKGDGVLSAIAAAEAIVIYARERQAKLEKEIPGGNP